MQSFPPLSRRVYSSKPSARINPQPEAHLRPPRYKQWTEEQMSEAYHAVESGVSIHRVAEEYKVPRSTLADRVSGKVLLGAKGGKKRYLEDEEEDELVRFLIKCANIGYPRSRSEVVAIVQRICNSRKLDVIVSLGWWERFCQRHPDISLRTASMLSRSRVIGSNTEAIDTYFDILEDTLVEYDC